MEKHQMIQHHPAGQQNGPVQLQSVTIDSFQDFFFFQGAIIYKILLLLGGFFRRP
jgi:hypothetical protein